MIDVGKICERVLVLLSTMNYELIGGLSNEQLIFPLKKQARGNIDRISEQELRQLFIDVFKENCPHLFYSIETPTITKHRFKVSFESENLKKQSALHDMCVYEKVGNDFIRKLNIEFKYGNGALKNTSKDIQKLVMEKEKGVFIHLLKNTRRNTLCNDGNTGVFDKLYESFIANNGNWNKADKPVQLIIISLKQKALIHREIKKGNNMKDIFKIKNCGSLMTFNGSDWGQVNLNSLEKVAERAINNKSC